MSIKFLTPKILNYVSPKNISKLHGLEDYNVKSEEKSQLPHYKVDIIDFNSSWNRKFSLFFFSVLNYHKEYPFKYLYIKSQMNLKCVVFSKKYCNFEGSK